MPETPPARDQTSPLGCLGLFVAWIVVTLLIFYGAISHRGMVEFVLTAGVALVIVVAAYGAWAIGRKVSG